MSEFKLHADGVIDQLGEGLLWSPEDSSIYWVDILAPAVRRLALNDGAVTTWAMPEPIGWLVRRRGRDDFIAGLKHGFAELSLDPVDVKWIGNPQPELPNQRMNDALVDPHGRIWAGTMDNDGGVPTGNLYRLDPDHCWKLVDRGYLVTNGPALAPDGRTFYHADTLKRVVYQFTLRDDGTLAGRTDFVTFEDEWGYPDGMACDAEGGVWVAHWGGGRVSRFTPTGRLDRSIILPTKYVTNVVFAGVGLDRLFVTTAAIAADNDPLAGRLFELDPGVRGLPPQRFAG